MPTTQTQTTTITDAIRDLELDDVLATREELALTGTLTDTDGNTLTLVAEYTGTPQTTRQALAELDEHIGYMS